MFTKTELVLALTQSLTDLIGGLMLIPFIIITAKCATERTKEKRLWITFFSFLSAACILGFIAHFACRSVLSFKLIWIPLYAIMFEAVNAFFFLTYHINSDGKKDAKTVKKIIYAYSIAAYLPVIYMELFTDINPIKIFVICAAIEAIAAFCLVVRPAVKEKDHGAVILLCSLIPLLPCIYFQVDRSATIHIIWDFECNGITHLCIIISLFVLFASATVRLKKKNQVN